MQELVFLITTNGDVEAAMKSSLDQRIPMLELTMPGLPIGLDTIMQRPSPRLIKTHLYSNFFAKSLNKAKSKFIVVLRDPKDCLVSYFNQYKNWLGFKGNFDEYFDIYNHKEIIFGDPFDFAVSYLEHKDEDNFLFVTYREMKEDIRRIIKRVAAFLNKELSDDIVEKIVEHTTFEQMKSNPMTNKKEVSEGFMRKGVMGDWVNYMNEDQRSKVDSNIKEDQEKYGITF